MIYVLKKIKIEQCHKLLLVLGVGLALTRSYSERWQVAQSGCVTVVQCVARLKLKLFISVARRRPLNE